MKYSTPRNPRTKSTGEKLFWGGGERENGKKRRIILRFKVDYLMVNLFRLVGWMLLSRNAKKKKN